MPSSRLVIPSTAFIGVRISWLMLARNSPFARLASSARALASCEVARALGDEMGQLALAPGDRAQAQPHRADPAEKDEHPARREKPAGLPEAGRDLEPQLRPGLVPDPVVLPATTRNVYVPGGRLV